MSAYVVDREHLLALVRTAVEGPSGRGVYPDNAWHGLRWYAVPDRELRSIGWRESEVHVRRLDWTTVEELARLLFDENVASVRYRYADADESGMIPDEAPFTMGDVRRAPRLSVGTALGALDCFEYQACEHDEWADSEARRFCDAFRRALCHAVSGYSWSVAEVSA